ncbi:hypothetical protein [Hyalangium rubrum]|uniref:Lipoprotein n=1 Tax=Hyalangium rubrum TaxID=3103134 RepID=A0ABU5HE44_9BACT|nr:hypothetical protein [Hyalangium sp. s54d21]MDY7231134.1 hypothetical protein [Hyalangium sp. s54d21]
MHRLSAAAAAALLLSATGCLPKDVPSEERLDRETSTLSMKDTPQAGELEKLNCENTADDLTKARNVNRPETERLMDYVTLYDSLRKRTQTFEEAMTRNPDLQYREGAVNIVAAKDTCIQQTADVRVEFENYMRELVEVPTVQEIKGGNTVTIARLDFNALRQAIETLSPDDKEQLLNRVASAEKKVSTAKAPEEEPAGAGGKRRGSK